MATPTGTMNHHDFVNGKSMMEITANSGIRIPE